MTRRPIQTTIENHYVWGQVCDGWHLVRSENLSVIEERMPPESVEQRHFHVRARQFFYVLEGELTMEIDGHFQTVGSRQGIEVFPGEAHQAANRSNAVVHFLVISEPPSQGDRQPA